jgi:hypothetical protein
MRSPIRSARWFALGALGAATACTILNPLDGFTGGAAAMDDGSSPPPPSDGSSPVLATDGGSSDDGNVAVSTGPVVVADVGVAPEATGRAQQCHLVWAERAARWVVVTFSGSDASQLRALVSSDFVAWRDAATLALPYPHGSEGRNLAVTTAVVNDVDALHVALSLRVGDADRRVYHARGTFVGDAIAFGGVTPWASTPSNVPALDPDGPAIALAADRRVFLFSAYDTDFGDGGGGTGNAYVYRSNAPDQGASGGESFTRDRIEKVPNFVNARGAVAIGAADVLTLYEDGREEPAPKNVRSSRWSGGAWSAPVDVFAELATLDANGWAFVRRTDTDVHAVRLRADGKLDHARWDGGLWRAGAPFPAGDAIAPGSGLALIATADGVALHVVTAAGAIASSAWTEAGATWTPWATVAKRAGPPRGLTGLSTSPTGPAALAWTEPGEHGHRIVGLRLR